jgi:hypothetical protein
MDNANLTDQQRIVYDLKNGEGMSLRAIARHLGKAYSSVQVQFKAAEAKITTDPAILDSMSAVGTNIVPALTWAKTKNKDGTSYSVLLKPAQADSGDMLDRLRDAFEGIQAAPQVQAPRYSDADLLALYPIADAHIGMQAWGKETGEDYDTAIACERMRDWMGRCVASAPSAETAIILDVGDLLHADDQTNQTPRSKHALDVDTRHFKTLDVTIAAMASAIELALEKHKRVIVRILPGNHDMHSYMAVLFALAERYRNNPRIDVQKDPGEFFAYEFGKVLIASHHGDKAKAERMVLFLAAQYPEMWGRTRHRFLWTGHLHHHKSADIGAVQWEQLRAVTARDAYAVSHAYSAHAQLQVITYHRERGEIGRSKVAA